MRMAGKRMRYWRIAAAAAVLLGMGLAFSGLARAVAVRLPGAQLGPALASCSAAFAWGSVLTVLTVAAVTFLLGRVYCAFFCPLGILQDIVGALSRRKGRPAPNARVLRYLIAGVSFGMVAAGWALPLLLLDPYSNFGRMAGSFTAGGMAALAAVAALAVWRKRIFCTSVCPVGTVLGLLAKRGVFRLTVAETCVRCNRCVQVCPAGCIDTASGRIDNERCVRCMNCRAVCGVGAIRFGRPERRPARAAGGRRSFLTGAAALAAGAAAGVALAKAGLGRVAECARRLRVLPPGAGDPERFAAACTGCQLCTANCPAGIIVPAPGGVGPVSVDLSRGVCRYGCHRCSSVCPTGALRPLTLEAKRRTKIAEAKLNPRVCIVFQEGEPCGKCAAACPTGAITLRKSSGAPKLNAALCIGCGACQRVCPASPEKAMTVHPIERQVTLENQNE